jgi:NAD(P)-dependent dehydrogenase (short-subunit alcohol dehydrogenase family)
VFLEGKVAIVTGANQGIGEGIAGALTREGASVVMVARREKELLQAATAIRDEGGTVATITADISKEADVQRIVQETVDQFGTLDIMVNNAGVAGPIGSIWDVDLAAFQQCLDINTTGLWLCCREAAAVMKDHGSGRIINIGSISGKRPLAQRTAYGASKMAVVGITRALALEIGEYNVTVNCISPGGIKGPRLAMLAEKNNMTLEQIYDAVSAGSALKRVPENEDIAALCVFLASEAGRNISGQDINVDAGTVMYS